MTTKQIKRIELELTSMLRNCEWLEEMRDKARENGDAVRCNGYANRLESVQNRMAGIRDVLFLLDYTAHYLPEAESFVLERLLRG